MREALLGDVPGTASEKRSVHKESGLGRGSTTTQSDCEGRNTTQSVCARKVGRGYKKEHTKKRTERSLQFASKLSWSMQLFCASKANLIRHIELSIDSVTAGPLQAGTKKT